MLAIFLWSFVALIKDAGDLAIKIYCFQVEFICFAAVPILWLATLLDYLGHRRLMTRRNLLLVSIVPALCTLLCWTNAAHGFVFSTSEIVVASGVPYLRLAFNWAFWVFIGYAYLLASLGVLACLLTALSSVTVYRRQAVLLLISGVAPLIVSALDFSYVILPAFSLTPMGFLFTGGAMVWGIYRHQLWDLTPVAYQVMFQTMRDGILVIDRQYRVVESNAAACAMLGVSPRALIGNSTDLVLQHLPGFSTMQLCERDMQLVSEAPGDDVNRAYDICVTPLRREYGKPTGWLVVLRDISERKQLERQLYTLAYYDALTELPNRMLLHDRLEQALTRNRRAHTGVGVIFLDLDGFKEINDSYGHSVGDDILRQTAQRLRQAVRGQDTVSRFGGDEFVLIFPDLDSRAALGEMATRILAVFADPFLWQQHAFTVTPSLGLTLAPADGNSVEELLKNADIAMYRAKDSGGACYAHFTDIPTAETTRV
jgi:diguanylate cyclase (GGDEF)-like protein/PAS domain S-box-containing protein